MRDCHLYNSKWKDSTKNSVFPSAVVRFRFCKNRFLDVESVSYDIKENKAREWEAEATRILQSRQKELGRFLPMSTMTVQPMYCYEDGIAMLLPLDNSVGRSFLTYKDPLWHKLLRELYLAFKANGLSEGVNALRTMVVGYNMHAPYSVEIRHDGSYSVGNQWKMTDAEYFGRKYETYLLSQLSTAIKKISEKQPDYERLIPKLNPTKSTGFNQRTYLGKIVNKADFLYVPESLQDKDTNLWARVDRGPFKESCISSGWVDENLDKVLSNVDKILKDPKEFINLVEDENCSIHKMSFRTNNADPSLIDDQTFMEWAKGKKVNFFHKDRNWCKVLRGSDGQLVYRSGTYKCKELNEKLNSFCGFEDPLDTNKKRAVYPAPTATFSPPYVCLFRAFLSDIEEGPMGFPSNRENVLKGYQDYFKLIGDKPRVWITFDRKNSEQFITDNYEFLPKLVGSKIGKILQFLGTSIFPSVEGPRVVQGGLPSGSASTTFDNATFGLFEMCNLISSITKMAFPVVCDAIFDSYLNEKGIVSLGSWVFKLNLGTDDQVLGVCNPNFKTNDNLLSFCDGITKHYEQRFLSFENGFNQTVFGMTFKETEVVVSKTLGLNKLFLAEKEKLGDAIALKMYCRSLLLPEYIPVIQDVFNRLGLGSFKTFRLGADNYFKQISKFGFDDVVDTSGKHYHGFESPLSDVFNEYSMAEKIIIGEALKVYDSDFITRPKKYQETDVLRWLKKFQNFFRS